MEYDKTSYVWDDDRGGFKPMSKPVTTGWTWDDDRGGFKPSVEDSGKYASVGGWIYPTSGVAPASEPAVPQVGSQPASSGQSSSVVASSVPSVAVKVATPDIIEFDSGTIPIELMQDLLFEDIGGQELLIVSRHDMLNGRPVAYHPIRNIGDISLQYNSDNILSMPDTIKNYFKNFNVVLSTTVVEIDGNDSSPNIYNDLDTQSQTFGSVVLEFKNLNLNQQVEVQILKNGIPFDDTIYVGTGVDS
jgi:hypothetical protein